MPVDIEREDYAILIGDAATRLRDLPDGSVRCCVTSPPYWGLRDYGHPGQLGLEASPTAYVDAMVAVFREVRRVLAEDGTLWMNLGDSYAGARCGAHGKHGMQAARDALGASRAMIAVTKRADGCKSKDLIGIPWMTAFALRDDGWYLRSEIIWAKLNPMPESVTDRPTKAHEYVFLMSKRNRYLYDADAIAEPYAASTVARCGGRLEAPITNKRVLLGDHRGSLNVNGGVDPDGRRNKRSVWSLASAPYKGAHFAVMPPALVEPCILAGSKVGDIVLDPFCGSGTVGMVARRLGRGFIGVELNPEYVPLAVERIEGER